MHEKFLPQKNKLFFACNLPLVIAALATACFTGCQYRQVNYEEIRRQLLCINPDDGISKKEAVVLAKKYFLEKGYGAKWSTVNPYAYYYEPTNEWFVEFGSKYYFYTEGRYRYTLRIMVSAKTGAVRTDAFCRYQ